MIDFSKSKSRRAGCGKSKSRRAGCGKSKSRRVGCGKVGGTCRTEIPDVYPHHRCMHAMSVSQLDKAP